MSHDPLEKELAALTPRPLSPATQHRIVQDLADPLRPAIVLGRLFMAGSLAAALVIVALWLMRTPLPAPTFARANPPAPHDIPQVQSDLTRASLFQSPDVLEHRATNNPAKPTPAHLTLTRAHLELLTAHGDLP